MSDAELLDLVRDTPWISERLMSIADFELERAEDGPVEPVHLAGGEPLEMIAGGASGGAFLLVGSGEERPVLYVGSEGTGGLVATSLREALALLVALPSLEEALGEPLDDGEALRSRLARADDELREYEPTLDADRQRLREALDLPPVDGLLEKLHLLAADEAYRPISDAGDRYDSMLTYL